MSPLLVDPRLTDPIRLKTGPKLVPPLQFRTRVTLTLACMDDSKASSLLPRPVLCSLALVSPLVPVTVVLVCSMGRGKVIEAIISAPSVWVSLVPVPLTPLSLTSCVVDPTVVGHAVTGRPLARTMTLSVRPVMTGWVPRILLLFNNL